jgi:atypical dual specificity phosphatase
VVEEKIDGANLGFSIDPVSFKVVAQNRSHYVNAKYHAQFAKLDQWIHDHGPDLFTLLEPGRHILFGEWLFFKHSIHYTRLPGLFVAFDLYDTRTRQFLPRDQLEALLQSTSIPLIHAMEKKAFTALTEVVALVQTPSQYYDGPVEGVVVRRVSDGVRAKIVREDFLSGDTHWSKGIHTRNLCAY